MVLIEEKTIDISFKSKFEGRGDEDIELQSNTKEPFEILEGYPISCVGHKFFKRPTYTSKLALMLY